MKLVQMFYYSKKMDELFFEKNGLQTSFDKESICFVRTKDIWTEFTEFQTLFYLNAHAILKRREKINYLITRIVIETNWETQNFFHRPRINLRSI